MPTRALRRLTRGPILLPALLAAALSAITLPLIALGDDIDIYEPPKDASFRPTLMFLIDTSFSTRFTENSWFNPRRRSRLLDPLVEFVRSVDSVRVGMSAFNGLQRGAAVLHPADELDRDLCPGWSCASVSVRAPVLRNSDDAQETISSGSMSVFGNRSTFVETPPQLAYQGRNANSIGDTVIETDPTGLPPTITAAEKLPLFKDENGDTTAIGIRWPYVEMPEDDDLASFGVAVRWGGSLFLDTDAGEGAGEARVRISVDSRADSPPFADLPGQRVSDRPRVPGHVDYTFRRPANWANTTDSGGSSYWLPGMDLHALIKQARAPGTNGPVTLLIEPAPDATLDLVNTVVIDGPDGILGPAIVIRSDDPNASTRSKITGLRFDQLRVPRGARITSAHVEIEPMSWGNDDNVAGDAEVEIRAELSGNAATFESAASDISARPTTSAAVDWEPDSWASGLRQASPDISSLVQEIVSRGDWCGGNALALTFSGTGERWAFFRDRGALFAPSLHVTYDPTSIDPATTCRAQTGSDVQALRSEGDVVQWQSNSPQSVEMFETADSRFRLGMRFVDVNLGAGDEIGEAVLTLTANDGALNPRFEVSVDTDTAAVPFDGPLSLEARSSGDPSLAFSSDNVLEGSRIASINIASLIQQAIDHPSWVRGSDIVLVLQRVGGNAVDISTSNAADGSGPRLRIARRLRGAAATGQPLRLSRDVLIERLQTLPAPTNAETPLVDAFHETAQYMIGGEVVHGVRRGEQGNGNVQHRLSDPGSYTGGNVYRALGCDADNPEDFDCVDEEILGTATYIAPPTSECRANQIVWLTDGEPSPVVTDTPTRILGMTGDAACDAAPTGQECATNLARWLAGGGAGGEPIQVNTIGFDFSSDFLEDVAREGDGQSFSITSAVALEEALLSIGQSAAALATFVAPTVPVSQFNRSSHRDDVYLGLFEPGGDEPLWPGNLKRYSLGVLADGQTIGLLDVNGDDALDPTTNRFASGARSFWSASPDGGMATAGGAASRLPLDRNTLTWPAASDGNDHGARALVPFHEDTNAILASEFGVNDAERDDVIRWMRGLDIRDEDRDGVTDEARRHMGAAIHTTPSVINYAEDDRSVIFLGTQEGFLHGIDTADGRELFAFMPHELYGAAGRFFEGVPGGAMSYGLDGPVTSWIDDDNRNGIVDSGDRAYVGVGMRRGGSHYYALDVTDPDNPTLAWTIDPSRAGFSALGQSWSAMKPARVLARENEATVAKSVLVFGNGYDTSNDVEERTVATALAHSDAGAIYIVDAGNGELLHHVDVTDHNEMVWSIPSDIAVIDTELDGIADLLLVGDVGGNLWRVDLTAVFDGDGVVDRTEPTLSIAARLADRPTPGFTPTAPPSAGNDRRFFHPPDVAPMRSEAGYAFLGVSIGSGRRDLPFGTDTTNRLFMLALDASNAGASPIETIDLTDATDTPTLIGPGSDGWYIDLERPGEKILGSPVIVDGRVLVTSYVPPAGGGGSNVCEPELGAGRIYGVDAFTADEALDGTTLGGSDIRSRELAGDGIPPPVAVVISEERPGALAVLVGAESVTDAELQIDPYRESTYWIAD